MMSEEKIEIKTISITIPEDLKDIDPNNEVFTMDEPSISELKENFHDFFPEKYEKIPSSPLSILEKEIENDIEKETEPIIEIVNDVIDRIIDTPIEKIEESIENIKEPSENIVEPFITEEFFPDSLLEKIRKSAINTAEKNKNKGKKESRFGKIISFLRKSVSKFDDKIREKLRKTDKTKSSQLSEKKIKKIESTIKKQLEEIEIDRIVFSEKVSSPFICFCNTVHIQVSLENEKNKETNVFQDENGEDSEILPGIEQISIL